MLDAFTQALILALCERFPGEMLVAIGDVLSSDGPTVGVVFASTGRLGPVATNPERVPWAAIQLAPEQAGEERAADFTSLLAEMYQHEHELLASRAQHDVMRRNATPRRRATAVRRN